VGPLHAQPDNAAQALVEPTLPHAVTDPEQTASGAHTQPGSPVQAVDVVLELHGRGFPKQWPEVGLWQPSTVEQNPTPSEEQFVKLGVPVQRGPAPSSATPASPDPPLSIAASARPPSTPPPVPLTPPVPCKPPVPLAPPALGPPPVPVVPPPPVTPPAPVVPPVVVVPPLPPAPPPLPELPVESPPVPLTPPLAVPPVAAEAAASCGTVWVLELQPTPTRGNQQPTMVNDQKAGRSLITQVSTAGAGVDIGNLERCQLDVIRHTLPLESPPQGWTRP
jgi:hypothetical protein